MENQLRLPKEFATKWIAALRSGEYSQGTASLFDYQGTNDNVGKYCCLGVGLSLCGARNIDLMRRNMPEDAIGFKDFPEELYDTTPVNESTGHIFFISKLMSTMNDGYEVSSLKAVYSNFPQLKEKMKEPVKPSKKVNYTFSEIADFIEQNFELY